MSEENNGYTPELPWTIERQLKAYANAEGHTDRHEILYHSWKQNSRWFAQMLEYTLGSYLSYSQHNVTHCQAVIHNIECLLGEQEIRQLSATDCYAILMTVYMHDIGMCITEDDKKSIINSNEFVDWIDRQMRSSNFELMDHIDYLRCHNYNFEETDNQIQKRENYKKLYSQKLETSKSTNHLIAEHQRKNHANVAANRMKEWVTESGQLYSGLSLTGIPNRIHLMLAECARLHGVSKVEDLMQMLMDLPESDNGFAQDMYHPRFISVLLLIGDALDIDNGRFHPYARTMMGGTLGETSEIHYRKHKAIRALQITARKIYIRADCEKPSEMRMLRNDINWLQRFIMECSYQWSKIAPANYCGYLPMVDFEQISLGGKPIAEKLVRAQFHLSQQKAFKLLEGASLYDNRFVYLREMLQNAADAIKFQYWNDLDATEFHAAPDVGLCEANNELPFRKYPIKIDFAIRKRRKDDPAELFSVTLDDLNMDEDERKNFEFGVEVSMQDCGVGIGEEDVNAISKVGTSQEHRHEIIQKMPPWLYPTGKFGIGLQSLFQADRLFKCVTRTHRDECYEMTFHSGTNNEGYINVIPRNWREGKNGSVPYGTKFTLFVPETHKESHTTNMSGWAGIDPYAADYIKSRSLRRSFELMKQMENQLDSWVGECIFPVVIREELLDISLRQAGWDKRLAPQRIPEMKKIMFKQVEAGNHKEQQRSETESLLCWIFQKGDEKRKFLRGELPDKSAYYLDVDQCVLHIWSQKATCFFACSPKRIVQSINKDNGPSKNVESPEERGNKIKIFLKGLLINEII